MVNNTCRNCKNEMYSIEDIVILDEQGNSTFDSNAKVKTIVIDDDIFILCPHCNHKNETISFKSDVGIQYRLK